MNAELIVTWLDHHRYAYWGPAVGLTLLLVLSALRRTDAGPPVSPWRFSWLMLLVLIAWRWPNLLFNNELNTDESQYIAGALTLRHDPMFWRSVDGMTAGPLVYYALVPWALFGAPLGYLTARVTALLLIWSALVVCYRTIRSRDGESGGRLSLLPGIIYIASVFSEDLNHYSSELISLPLTAVSVALIMKLAAADRPAGWVGWFSFGVLVGLHPWAKLQIGPIGAILGLTGLIVILRQNPPSHRQRWVFASALVGGALLPAAGVVATTLAGGAWEHFWHAYIRLNLVYAQEDLPRQWNPLGFFEHPSAGWSFLLTVLLPVLLTLLVVRSQRRLPVTLLAVSPLVGIALACVMYPQRSFAHYTLLLLVPVVYWTGLALGEWRRSRPGSQPRLPALAATAFAAAIFVLRLSAPAPAALGSLRSHHLAPREEIAGVLGVVAEPGERLAVWGWEAQSYVQAGLRQATREAYTYWCIVPTPLREEARRVFLADFIRNRPEAFLDSVGPNAIFFQDRPTTAHETFPALAALVARDYQLVIDLDYARIYARKDVAARRGLTPDAIAHALAQSRSPRWIDLHLPVENLGAQTGTLRRIAGKEVLMMLPPSQASWLLAGQEREILFETGYAPEAVGQSQGNGTELALTLHSPDGKIRPVHTLRINPREVPADRQPRNHRVALPPFEPGTRLVIRSSPGPDNDDAWDWAYLAQVRFLRSPHYTWRQFPRFNLPPVRAAAPLSTHVPAPEGGLLLLHAPAQFDLALDGAPRELNFAFGFLPGAYASTEQTHGATFKIEAECQEKGRVLLAERQLRPASEIADRGKQFMKLAIPAANRLIFTIDSDDSPAFDWTYVTDLQLN